MADLGQLAEFEDAHDLEFRFKNRKYTVDWSAADLIKWTRDYEEAARQQQNGESDYTARTLSWIFGARLLGGEFDTGAWEFTGPKDSAIMRLITQGASLELIDRIITTAILKVRYSTEFALRFWHGNDLKKAVADSLAGDSKKPETVTPSDAGETSEDGSETGKD